MFSSVYIQNDILSFSVYDGPECGSVNILEIGCGTGVTTSILRQKNSFAHITAAMYLARWLFYNNGNYYGKDVVDIGTGTGILGITAAIRGAASVTLSDIAKEPYVNAQENVTKQGLSEKVSVVRGNLFESIDHKTDFLIFNHPFFPEYPYADIPVSQSMLGGEELFEQFLLEAPDYLNENGRVMTSYFHLAGETNSPLIKGEKAGYDVFERFRIKTGTGIQRGAYSIYEMFALSR